jgi:hypothetical protein
MEITVVYQVYLRDEEAQQMLIVISEQDGITIDQAVENCVRAEYARRFSQPTDQKIDSVLHDTKGVWHGRKHI